MKEIKSLYLVVEGTLDGVVLNDVLDFSKYHKKRIVVTKSKSSIPSYIRTLRLMVEQDAKILVVFDADVIDEIQAMEQIENMRQLSHTINNVNVKFFSFVPNMETHLDIQVGGVKSENVYKRYIEEHMLEVRRINIIREMQSFIDGV